jgi:alpha-tubulin suppressor-like RCC1 family protein
MAATETGVWDLQDVRDKQLEGEWSYDANDPHTLYAWGRDSQGELGLNYKAPGNAGSRSSPTQVGTNSNWNTVTDGKESNFTIGTKTDGTLWSWGYGNQGELGQNSTDGRSSPIQIPGTTWSKNISTGENFAMATKTDGTLWGWGKNPDGSMGQNNQTKYSSPIQIPGTWADAACGNKHALGVKTDGTLWCWGDGGGGQLGQNNTTSRSSPIQVGSDTTWSKVIGSWFTNMAVKTDGTLWVWGNGDSGTLGQGDGGPSAYVSSPIQITGSFPTGGTGYTASGGRFHNAFINTSGELFITGKQEYGQLGDNSTVGKSSPVQVPGSYKFVVTGNDGTGAIKTDGTMWMWGGNQYGEVGKNDTNSGYSSPVQVGALSDWATMGSAQLSFFGLREA